MTTFQEDKEFARKRTAKVFMVACSIGAGIAVYVQLTKAILRFRIPQLLESGVVWFVSIGAALIYPVVAASLVKGVAILRIWAREDAPVLTPSSRLFLGAFWPITFPGAVILYTFLGLINRRF